MQTLIPFFVFTTLESSMWNAAAYVAFIGIIIGVYREKYRNWLITIGAAILALYAGIFLHDPLFTILQSIIVYSSASQLLRHSKRYTTISMIFATIISYALLFKNNEISNIWTFIGSLGLLGIAFGFVILPKRYGFLVMAIGGVFLTIYAYTVSAQVFILLNIFFTAANIQKWHENK